MRRAGKPTIRRASAPPCPRMYRSVDGRGYAARTSRLQELRPAHRTLGADMSIVQGCPSHQVFPIDETRTAVGVPFARLAAIVKGTSPEGIDSEACSEVPPRTERRPSAQRPKGIPDFRRAQSRVGPVGAVFSNLAGCSPRPRPNLAYEAPFPRLLGASNSVLDSSPIYHQHRSEMKLSRCRRHVKADPGVSATLRWPGGVSSTSAEARMGRSR